MNPLRTRLYAAVIACGLLMIPLSFLPWLRFTSVEVEGDTRPSDSFTFSGEGISRWHDRDTLGPNDPQREVGWCSCEVGLGDGYLTAALGIVLVVVAGLGWYDWRDRAAGIAGVIAALLAFGLTGFDAIADWKAIIWTSNGSLEAAEGDVRPALYGLIAVSALAAVVSAVLWGLGWLSEYAAEEDEMMDDEMPEETEQ
jgi:hypothetical protein